MATVPGDEGALVECTSGRRAAWQHLLGTVQCWGCTSECWGSSALLPDSKLLWCRVAAPPTPSLGESGAAEGPSSGAAQGDGTQQQQQPAGGQVALPLPGPLARMHMLLRAVVLPSLHLASRLLSRPWIPVQEELQATLAGLEAVKDTCRALACESLEDLQASPGHQSVAVEGVGLEDGGRWLFCGLGSSIGKGALQPTLSPSACFAVLASCFWRENFLANTAVQCFPDSLVTIDRLLCAAGSVGGSRTF